MLTACAASPRGLFFCSPGCLVSREEQALPLQVNTDCTPRSCMTCLIGLSYDFPNWFIHIYDGYVVGKYKSIANSFTKLLSQCAWLLLS